MMKFTWGHGIIVFFSLFFIWIIGFVIFTLGENNDLVTKDYYKKGAEYSKHMATDQRSRIYKDSITIENNHHVVSIKFSNSLTSNPSTKEIYFYRPSNKADDYKLLADMSKSPIAIPKSKLKNGRYKVSFSWIEDDKAYQITKDFTVN